MEPVLHFFSLSFKKSLKFHLCPLLLIDKQTWWLIRWWHKCSLRLPSSSTASFLFSLPTHTLFLEGESPLLCLCFKSAGAWLGCPSRNRHEELLPPGVCRTGDGRAGLAQKGLESSLQNLLCAGSWLFTTTIPAPPSGVQDWVRFLIDMPLVTISAGVVRHKRDGNKADA